MRRLRVLTLVDHLIPWGGAERLAMTVALRLDQARFERVLCASRSADPALVSELEEGGVEVLSLERRSRATIWQWAPLLAELRRRRVDVVHAHMFHSNVWGTFFGRLAGVPVVVAHEHTWSFQGEPLRRLLDRRLVARGADVFLAVSSEDRRRMIEVEGIDPAAIRIVLNGIPAPTRGSGDVRRELGIPARAPVIGTVSVLRKQKALDVLLRAAATLLSEFPALRILVAGVGPEEERLRSLAAELGLESAVTMLGLRGDVPDVLAALDVFVSSSDFEGTPLALIEAMAAGRPIVATRVGGVPDLIDEGIHGRLVEPREPEALAKAVAELLRDPKQRAELGARALERQRRELGVDAMIRRLEDLYESLFLASARARRELRASAPAPLPGGAAGARSGPRAWPR